MTQRTAPAGLVKSFTSTAAGARRGPAVELQVEMRGTTHTFRRGTMKRSIAILLALAVIGIWTGSAQGFHDDGVAHCNGCHTMHNSQGGVSIATGGTAGQGVNSYLLTAATPSDTCLRCHAAAGRSYQVLATDPLVPTRERGAGDFVFLKEDNLNDGHGAAILGHQAGHNVVAPGFGIGADPVLTTAPGGTFPAADMACSSCHDPHGTEAFRLLYGAGRLVKTDGTTYLFNNAAPVADGLALDSTSTESNGLHTAYKSGMSAWCGNCHGNFHNNIGALVHPSGTPIGNDIASAYNAYNGTTDCVNNPGGPGMPCGTGTQAAAYLAQVPFEDPGNTTTSTAGPTSGSMVMCLTCHRSHATSSPDAGRWDFNVTLLEEDGHGGAYALPNPYDANQRSLCNKCHSQDEFDHLPNP